MKHVYNYQEYKIFEGASDILYHFTYIDSLLNMLIDNEFSLTSAIGSSSDYNVNKKKFFYFSTTRSRSTGFKKGEVKIVLDGRKLKHNNKITPVDYWAWSKDRKDYIDVNSYSNALQSTEQEDRIVSDKATIPNAINYIKEIHIFKEIKYLSPENINRLNKKLKQIIDICDNNHIKLYMYDTKDNWLNQIKPISNDIEINIEEESDADEKYSSDYFRYDIASALAYNDLDNYNTIKNYLNDDDKIKKLDKVLKDRTESCFRINAYYFDDGITAINNDIGSIRTKSDKNSKFLLLLLVKEFKKYNVQTIKEYIKKKQFINKKTLDDYKKDLKKFLVSKMLNEYQDGLSYKFYNYIEIDGEYYNHAYESDELLKVIYEYMKKIRDYLDSVIFSKDDIFKYSYTLDRDYIKKYIGFEDIKLSDKINITDSYDDVEDIDRKFKDLIYLYLIQPISANYYEKIQSLKDEYGNQFNEE